MSAIVQVLAAGVAGAAFSVLFGVRRSNVLMAALTAAVGYAVLLFALRWGELPALFLAGASIDLFSELAARLRKTPSTLFLVGGLIPLVPGGTLFDGLVEALVGQPGASALLLYKLVLQAGAIALGIIVVSSVFRVLPHAGKHGGMQAERKG